MVLSNGNGPRRRQRQRLRTPNGIHRTPRETVVTRRTTTAILCSIMTRCVWMLASCRTAASAFLVRPSSTMSSSLSRGQRHYPQMQRLTQRHQPPRRMVRLQSYGLSSTASNNDNNNDNDTTDSPIRHDDQDDYIPNDTIFAVSSGSSTTATAVAVIRMSGPDSGRILQQLSKNGDATPLPNPRTAALRQLFHPISNAHNNHHNHNTTRAALDHALVLYFPSPHSFTGDDVVELQCHGSRAVVTAVTDALLWCGARVAEPGEFTSRAFAAGKLDVLQVEALADLLGADTATQRTQALAQLDGQLSMVYTRWRAQLIAGLAHAEAVIDFGDDERLDEEAFFEEQDDAISNEVSQQEQQAKVWGQVAVNMQDLCHSMQRQVQDERRGELVRTGVTIAIVGPVNAGKSSLFNLLSRREAAIVSDTAGTTRDVLEVQLNLGGVKVILQDTAGVRSETSDQIEVEGMKRALAAAADADLVVAMVDSTDSNAGLATLETVLSDTCGDGADSKERIDPSQVMLLCNKVDLLEGDNDGKESSTVTSQSLSSLTEQMGERFDISCTTQRGLDSFLSALTDRVGERVGTTQSSAHTDQAGAPATEGALITRARHRQHVHAALEALERFLVLSSQGNMAVDMAAEELRLAASELGRITGAVDVEDVLDKLFSDFCIGK